MRLWLLRHAQPLIAPGVCYGASDIPADAALTRLAAQRFLGAFGDRPLILWHSPLQRCAQLAAAIQDQCGATGLRQPLHRRADARLREMDFGIWERQAWAAIPPTEFDTWLANFAHHPFGGAETVQHMLDRVGAALEDVCAHAQGARDVVWVTHAGVARAARLWTQGIKRITQATEWPREAPPYGEWALLSLLDGNAKKTRIDACTP